MPLPERRDAGRGRAHSSARAAREGLAAPWPRSSSRAASKFEDYSALAIRGERIAVASQQTSRLWLGKLRRSDWTIEGAGRQYDFREPRRGSSCICDGRGISWLTDEHVRRRLGPDERGAIPAAAKRRTSPSTSFGFLARAPATDPDRSVAFERDVAPERRSAAWNSKQTACGHDGERLPIVIGGLARVVIRVERLSHDGEDDGRLGASASACRASTRAASGSLACWRWMPTFCAWLSAATSGIASGLEHENAVVEDVHRRQRLDCFRTGRAGGTRIRSRTACRRSEHGAVDGRRRRTARSTERDRGEQPGLHGMRRRAGSRAGPGPYAIQQSWIPRASTQQLDRLHLLCGPSPCWSR